MYKLCAPAMVYVVLAGISILLALFSKFHVFSILTKIVFVGAWTWFLNYLCMKGYKVISWFLVLLPFLVMLGIFTLAAEIVNVASKQALPPSYQKEGMKVGGDCTGLSPGATAICRKRQEAFGQNCYGLKGTALAKCNAGHNGF